MATVCISLLHLVSDCCHNCCRSLLQESLKDAWTESSNSPCDSIICVVWKDVVFVVIIWEFVVLRAELFMC